MIEPEQAEKIKELLNRGEETFRAAETLLKEGFYRDAVSRAFYAAFNSVQALLLYHGKTFSSHRAILSSLHRDVIRTGLLSKESGAQFTELFDHRKIGDYRTWPKITKEEAEKDVRNARAIIDEVKKWLAENSGYFAGQ